MLAVAPQRESKITQNCKIKTITSEINIIKNVIGIHQNIPECIYLKIQELLSSKEQVNTILKWRTSTCCYWVKTKFIPTTENNVYQKFTIKTEFISSSCVNKITKLYQKLIDIEKQVSIKHALKYLDGFLEDKSITFNELPQYLN